MHSCQLVINIIMLIHKVDFIRLFQETIICVQACPAVFEALVRSIIFSVNYIFYLIIVLDRKEETCSCELLGLLIIIREKVNKLEIFEGYHSLGVWCFDLIVARAG